VTGKQVAGAIYAVLVLFGPLVLLVALPEHEVVKMLFGGVRLYVFYAITIGLAFWFSRDAIRYWANSTRKSSKSE